MTINFLNDPFEIERPNKDRHVVWDGWAVRAEHGPAEVSQYPGRKWLYSQSHAFYAFRRWQHERGKPEAAAVGDEPIDFGTPSEGSYQDLVVDSHEGHAQQAAELAAAEQSVAASRERVVAVEHELDRKRDELDNLVREASSYEFDDFDAEVARGRPGDIVEEDLGEESRSVVLSAGLIRKAARERDKHLDSLLRKQARKGVSQAKDLIEAEQQLLAERAALRTQIASGIPLIPPPKSVFDEYLQQLRGLCAEHGTELVVIALPVDVQVDPTEWDKYGVSDRPDMSESLVLLGDLVDNAAQLGIRGLDATEALRSAEPGAFLDHDIHMTARGHAALAEALAERLAAPLPIILPGTGLPEGRSFVPASDEWGLDSEVIVSGSSKAGCSTQLEREWLSVRCRRPLKNKREGYGGVEVLEGGTPATMAIHSEDGQSLVTPLTVGQPLTARFTFAKQVRELRVTWPADDAGQPKFVGEFVDVEGSPGAQAPSASVTKLCERYMATRPDLWCAEGDEYESWDCRESCGGLWGDERLVEPCMAAFAGAATGLENWRIVSCMQNDPLSAPACPAGSVHAFASNACFAACDDGHACAVGSCVDWQGGGVCVGQ